MDEVQITAIAGLFTSTIFGSLALWFRAQRNDWMASYDEEPDGTYTYFVSYSVPLPALAGVRTPGMFWASGPDRIVDMGTMQPVIEGIAARTGHRPEDVVIHSFDVKNFEEA